MSHSRRSGNAGIRTRSDPPFDPLRELVLMPSALPGVPAVVRSPCTLSEMGDAGSKFAL